MPNSTLDERVPKINNPANIPSNHMTEDEFLQLRGVGTPFGDAGIDRVGGANMFYLSEKQRKKALADIAAQNELYYSERAKAREEYNALVAEGLIIPKTTIERIITSAYGNPELNSTKAARRMATKYGIDWETGKPLDLFKLTDGDIEKAWDDLSDVPFTEDKDGTLVLDCDWRNYPKGTDRETIWHDFDMAHSKGVHYLIYERDDELADKAAEAQIDCSSYSYHSCVDVEKINSSMQLDSSTVVATIQHNGKEIASIDVYGEVDIAYRGETYHSASEYSEDLKGLMEIDPYWFENPDVFINHENRFEFSTEYSDTLIAVDAEHLTRKEIYTLLAECLEEASEKKVIPKDYETFLNNGGHVVLADEKQETKQVPRFENKYYIPELDINGTAEELFIEVRNGYCDKQPEKIAKIAELIENEAQVNHDSELTHKAEIVRAAHEVATSDVSGLADKRMNVAQMKYDLLTNDNIYDIDEVPLDDLGDTTASVKYENDTVLISVSDTYKDGNDTVYAQGASSYTREEFLNFSQTDFNAAIGSIIAYSMNETDRVAGKPEKEKSIIERD